MNVDTISDTLTRIRNALQKKHNFVILPLNTMNKILSKILLTEGYIQNIEEKFQENKKFLILDLKYKGEKHNKASIINNIKRISKPGLRVYVNNKEIPIVLGGLGIAILSTSKGVLSDKKARQLGVGGELLCLIW